MIQLFAYCLFCYKEWLNYSHSPHAFVFQYPAIRTCFTYLQMPLFPSIATRLKTFEGGRKAKSTTDPWVLLSLKVGAKVAYAAQLPFSIYVTERDRAVSRASYIPSNSPTKNRRVLIRDRTIGCPRIKTAKSFQHSGGAKQTLVRRFPGSFLFSEMLNESGKLAK